MTRHRLSGRPAAGDDHLDAGALIVRGLARRFDLPRLERRHDKAHVVAVFSFVAGCISIAVMSVAAVVTRQPLIFPSLGPTAFLLFYTPQAASASPRSTLAGHLIGVGAGYASLWIFALTDAGPALAEGVTWSRVGAAALSLGLTSGLMIWLAVPHPPAGATTLIVSLGILTTPTQLAVLMLAVVLLLAQAYLLLRFAGVRYPAGGSPVTAPRQLRRKRREGQSTSRP